MKGSASWKVRPTGRRRPGAWVGFALRSSGGSVHGPSWPPRGLFGQLVTRPVSTGNAHFWEPSMPGCGPRWQVGGGRRPWAPSVLFRRTRGPVPALRTQVPRCRLHVRALNKGLNVRPRGS